MKYFNQWKFAYFRKRLVMRQFCKKALSDTTDLFLSKLTRFYQLEEDSRMVVPIFKKALLYGNKKCIQDFAGEYSYIQLYSNSKRLSRQISNICGSASSSTIAFFYSNDVLTSLTLWATWMSGQIAMPLMNNQPFSCISEFAKTKKAKIVITPEKHFDLGCKLAKELDIALLVIDHDFIKKPPFDITKEVVISGSTYFLKETLTNEFYTEADALLDIERYIENSKSKTVLLNHKDINSKTKSLLRTWHISSNDRVLNLFPSQNIAGDINSILFPLSAGSTLYFLEPFDGNRAWSCILGINIPLKERINVILSEPFVYKVLIKEYDKMFAKNTLMVEYIKDYCLQNVRLMMVFGNVSCTLYSRWLEITGHTLLESKFTKPCLSSINNYVNTRSLSSPNI